jgi:hypothetical protein
LLQQQQWHGWCWSLVNLRNENHENTQTPSEATKQESKIFCCPLPTSTITSTSTSTSTIISSVALSTCLYIVHDNANDMAVIHYTLAMLIYSAGAGAGATCLFSLTLTSRVGEVARDGEGSRWLSKKMETPKVTKENRQGEQRASCILAETETEDTPREAVTDAFCLHLHYFSYKTFKIETPRA